MNFSTSRDGVVRLALIGVSAGSFIVLRLSSRPFEEEFSQSKIVIFSIRPVIHMKNCQQKVHYFMKSIIFIRLLCSSGVLL